ncbi:pyridoxal-phosphate dependent enzyme, partial [Arthrospira platensis SPKY1]|nr:pyridoxal-phosphate dependent enzyme [Arthrospira platensis SPKY1]
MVAQDTAGSFDAVLVPVGCGTNFGAIYKGFKECFEAGLAPRIPQMVAVQPDGCSPVIEGLRKGQKIIKSSVYTQAGAVAAADPVDFVKVQQGIEATQGLALTVSEDEMVEALKEMVLTQGYFTEP